MVSELTPRALHVRNVVPEAEKCQDDERDLHTPTSNHNIPPHKTSAGSGWPRHPHFEWYLFFSTLLRSGFLVTGPRAAEILRCGLGALSPSRAVRSVGSYRWFVTGCLSWGAVLSRMPDYRTADFGLPDGRALRSRPSFHFCPAPRTPILYYYFYYYYYYSYYYSSSSYYRIYIYIYMYMCVYIYIYIYIYISFFSTRS